MVESVNCIHCGKVHAVTYLCPQARKAGVTKESPIESFTTPNYKGPEKPVQKAQRSAHKDESPQPEPIPKDEPDKLTQGDKKTDADYVREWREKNREHYNETMRQWRERNREKLREYKREYMRKRRQHNS